MFSAAHNTNPSDHANHYCPGCAHCGFSTLLLFPLMLDYCVDRSGCGCREGNPFLYCYCGLVGYTAAQWLLSPQIKHPSSPGDKHLGTPSSGSTDKSGTPSILKIDVKVTVGRSEFAIGGNLWVCCPSATYTIMPLSIHLLCCYRLFWSCPVDLWCRQQVWPLLLAMWRLSWAFSPFNALNIVSAKSGPSKRWH